MQGRLHDLDQVKNSIIYKVPKFGKTRVTVEALQLRAKFQTAMVSSVSVTTFEGLDKKR